MQHNTLLCTPPHTTHRCSIWFLAKILPSLSPALTSKEETTFSRLSEGWNICSTWKLDGPCVRRGSTPAWTAVTSREKKTCNRYVSNSLGVLCNCKWFFAISGSVVTFRPALPCPHRCTSLLCAEPAGVRQGYQYKQHSTSHVSRASSCLQGLEPSSPYSWINEWNCAEIEYVLNREISWAGEILTGAFPLRYDYLANSTFPRIKGADKKMLFSPTPSWPTMLRTTSSHLNFVTNSPFICRCWDAILRSG